MRKKLLVFASTFPRCQESMILEHDQEPQFLTWKDDTSPPFVYELSKRLTKDFDVYVLAPHYPGAERYEVMDRVRKVDKVEISWVDGFEMVGGR